MRVKLSFKSKNKEIPIDYKRHIIHFLKESISNYDKDLFEKLYLTNAIKPFSFAVYFNDSKMYSDKFILGDNHIFTVYVSVGDSTLALKMFNSFIGQTNKEVTSCGFTSCLTSMTFLPQKNITTNSLRIKFLSPLVLQTHSKDKDYFYSVNHAEFGDVSNKIISQQLMQLGTQQNVNDIKIKPINARKTVVKFYEKNIESSIGEFLLEGNPELLQLLYDCGIGSKRSSGFGLFEVIGGNV